MKGNTVEQNADVNKANAGHGGGGDKPDATKHLVTINVDGKEQQIEKGKYEVADLKKLFGIPADYELDQVINGTFEPLANDASVQIHGGEVFVSHVRGGGSS
jgi:hypothetical protein